MKNTLMMRVYILGGREVYQLNSGDLASFDMLKPETAIYVESSKTTKIAF